MTLISPISLLYQKSSNARWIVNWRTSRILQVPSQNPVWVPLPSFNRNRSAQGHVRYTVGRRWLKGVTILGLPDKSAAFGTVGHDILLLHKIESSFGVGGTVLSWIRSFLQSRTQQVYIFRMEGVQCRHGHFRCSSRKWSRAALLHPLHSRHITHHKGVHCYADDGPVFPRKGLIRGGKLFCLYCRNREMDGIETAEAEFRQNPVHLDGYMAAACQGGLQVSCSWLIHTRMPINRQ